MSEYTDVGLNVEKVISNIPEHPKDFINFVDLILPGWLCKRAAGFAKEIERFNIGWIKGCVQIGVEPPEMGILIVKDTYLGARENRKILSALIRKAVDFGYLVIDTINFDVCSNCGLVIVSERRMSEKKYFFSGKCQGCFKYDPRKPLDQQEKTKEKTEEKK